MERDLAMAAFGAAAMGRELSSPSESRSTSSSGCQSGWTLYLDHSNDGAARRRVPCDPAAQSQRWMVLQQAATDGDEEEDSMASDASSGPRPRPHDGHDEAHRGYSAGLLRCRCHGFVVVDQRGSCCSVASGQPSRGSGCLGGSCTWSRSSQDGAKGGVTRKAAVVTGRSQYREIIVIDDDEDDLDDTASSSSAVFSCPMPMVHGR